MSLFERYMRFRGYDIPGATKFLGDLSRSTREELDRRQTEAAWAVARFHHANNPLYRSKLKGPLPARWEDLPIMGKTDYQTALGGILTDGMSAGDLYTSSTSGSSGHPFTFAKDKFAHACSWALIRQRFGWHGITLSSRQARFYGIPLDRRQYAAEKLKDRLMNRVRFPVFDLSDEALDRFAFKFRKNSFDFIYGYTNSLVIFARHVHRKGIDLKAWCPTLRLCIVTSETCTPEDRAILEQGLGVKVVIEYGASEVAVIAFENLSGELIVSEENLMLEIVDEGGTVLPDGESGSILITDLHNRALPFIRYRIGDLGTLGGPAAPGTADPRKRLRSLEGRINDTILLPSGKRAAGMTFYYISRRILESSGVLKEFVIHQRGIADFEFEVVTDRPLERPDEDLIHGILDRYLEPGLNLRIRRVQSITRPVSGKIKHFYSELNT
jgi:phenylacetate-CoA ligase